MMMMMMMMIGERSRLSACLYALATYRNKQRGQSGQIWGAPIRFPSFFSPPLLLLFFLSSLPLEVGSWNNVLSGKLSLYTTTTPRGSGERCKLSQRGLEQIPSQNQISKSNQNQIGGNKSKSNFIDAKGPVDH